MARKKIKSTPAGVQRITLSLPQDCFAALESLRRERGFANRSQAVTELIRERHVAHREAASSSRKEIMAGTITLFYDANRRGLLSTLAKLQQQHISEVISSLHVPLEDHHIMEVLLVQGPAHKLQTLVDLFVSRKGVRAARLALTSTIMPPIHSAKT